MVSAKLLVLAGAPDQARRGEIFCPVQPKALNTCSLWMVPPSLISGLVSVKPSARAAPASAIPPPKAAARIVLLCMFLFTLETTEKQC
jgi:hypothetical protein